MTGDLQLLGTSRMLPYIVLLPLAPIVIVLVWLAFRFAATAHQRLANLVCGGVGSVTAPFVLVFVSDPAPNGLYENTFAVFVIATMIAGAALGVSLCAVSRKLLTQESHRRDES